MRHRLQANTLKQDCTLLIAGILEGLAIATPGTLGYAASIWVRDHERRVEANQEWNDLPVRVLGELFVVSDNS